MTTAAEYAELAAIEANSAQTAAVDVQNQVAVAESSANLATTHANTIGSSIADATAANDTAALQAIASKNYRDLAALWANADPNVLVEGSLFSARHHAASTLSILTAMQTNLDIHTDGYVVNKSATDDAIAFLTYRLDHGLLAFDDTDVNASIVAGDLANSNALADKLSVALYNTDALDLAGFAKSNQISLDNKISEYLDEAGQLALQAMLSGAENATRLSYAGVVVDPADGTITNAAGSAVATEYGVRMASVEEVIDGQGKYTLAVEQQLGENIAAVQLGIDTDISPLLGTVAANYSVKSDANGHIAGFGLLNTASTDVTGSSFSEFVVAADNFSVGGSHTDAGGNLVVDETVPFRVVTGAGMCVSNVGVRSGNVTQAACNAVSGSTWIAPGTWMDNVYMEAANISGMLTIGGEVEVAISAAEDRLQTQIDGSITTWFLASAPTTGAGSAPYNTWTTAEAKNQHLGDLYYDTTSGFAYRFAYEDIADSPDAGVIYSWIKIVDTDVTAALQAASDAQASADGKIRLFVSTPTVPYDIGDLWDTGSGIKRATTDVATGSAYSSSHWLLITDAEGSAAIAAGTALWNGVSGTGRPADDATVGATWGTDLIGKPSDSRLFSNLLKVEDWVIGTTGSQGSFSQNGQTSENKISLLIGPNEETQPVWEGTNDGVNDADAGWNHSNIPIDHAKSYRSIVWMMQNSSDGSMYHGCGGGSTNNLSGTANGNPYFWFGDLPVTDRWYMGVGIIHGSGYGTTDTGVSGIYDPMTGSKVISAIDYKNKVGASTQVHRSFHYYGTTVGSKAYFARPRFELIDGSEPSLASLLGGNAILNSVITDNIYSANTTTINGGNITTDSIKADSILIDGNIEFSSVASGVQFGKNSLGDSSPGAFFGRSGGVAGFSISSPTSSIYADSSGQLILNRVTLFASSPGPTSSYDGSGYHYYNIPTAMSVLSVIVVGAGAGAGNTAVPSRGTSPRDGGAGTSSWIEFYTGTNGSGNLITVAGVSRYTASGAPYTPYSVGSNNTNQPGYAGYNSSQPNSGGVGGGVKPYPINGGLPGSPGTRGGGGGGGGVRGYNGSPEAYVNRHANAGSTFSQYINRPSDANSVKIYLGVGGIGGYSTGTTKGGDGGAGFASMTDPYSGATEVDLIDLMNRVAALE